MRGHQIISSRPAGSSAVQICEDIYQLAGNLQKPDILALIAALADGELAQNAFQLWRDQLNWNDLPATVRRVLPLLHHNMSRLNVTDPMLERIKGVRRYMWAKNLWLVSLAKLVHRELSRSGINAAALKGTSLVSCGLVDRTVRPMEDVDIVVQPDRLQVAIDALTSIGFRPLFIEPDVVIHEIVPDYRWSGWAFINDSNQQVDLHWSAFKRRPDSDAAAWSHSRLVNFEGVDIRVFDPADQVLQTCLHGAQDTDNGTIRWILDVVLILRRAQIDWDYIVERAAAHRASAILKNSLQVVNTVDRGRIPDRVIDALQCNQTWDQAAELHAVRVPSGSWKAGLATRFLAFQSFRNSLAVQSFCEALEIWLRRKYGTRTAWQAIRRAAYFAIGRPRFLRRILNADQALDIPNVSGLKTLGIGQHEAQTLDRRSYLTGWSIAEKGGRWTDGSCASMALRLAPLETDVTVALIGRAALTPMRTQMSARLFVDDKFEKTWTFRTSDHTPAKLTFHHSASDHPGDRPTIITIEIEETFTPRSAGQSSDVRKLGLFLEEIHVLPAVSKEQKPDH